MTSSKEAVPGKYPAGASSLRAQVLAVMLAGEDMIGMDSIFEHRKVTLNTVVRALMRKYEWPIERRDFPTNTPDGRAAWASVWSLPPQVIEAALAGSGGAWLEGVQAARSARARRPLRR